MKDKDFDERELYELKWWDYRMLKPDVCTLSFMREWVKAAAEFNELVKGTRYINVLKRFKRFDLPYLRGHEAWKVLQRLRQWADAQGMPYDHFWAYAYEAHIKLGFDRPYLPVFQNEHLLGMVKEAWQEAKRVRVIWAESPWFKADKYQASQMQDDYFGYLLREIKSHYSKAFAQETLVKCVREGTLPVAYFKRYGAK